MNFSVFDTGEKLQSLIAFLTHCENHGVTDIRFVRQRAEEFLTRSRRTYRMTAEQREESRQLQRARKPPGEVAKETGQKAPPGVCPSCGRGRIIQRLVEGVTYEACKYPGSQGPKQPQGCGWSRMVN